MTQLCRDEGIECYSIHASEELAFSFVEELGMSADDSGVGADVLDDVVSSKGDIVGDNSVSDGGDNESANSREVTSGGGQVSMKGGGSVRAKGGMGTRKSSRRKGAYKEMSTQSLLEVLSEYEKGNEFEAKKSEERGGRLGVGKSRK